MAISPRALPWAFEGCPYRATGPRCIAHPFRIQTHDCPCRATAPRCITDRLGVQSNDRPRALKGPPSIAQGNALGEHDTHTSQEPAVAGSLNG